MSVKFTVQSQFNFSSNSYLIVFNTSNTSDTNTVTPVASATVTGFAGYSLGIVVGDTSGAITAQAFSYYRPNDSSQLPQLFPIGVTDGLLTLNPNSNGQENQFEVIFDRIIAQFNGSATTAPTTSPVPSPGTTPAPSTSPTGVPSGVLVTQYWTFNFFTIQGTIQLYEAAQNVYIIDSLGQGGATDSTYRSQVLNVDQPFDYPVYADLTGQEPTPDQIIGGEIANNSGAAPSPSPAASAS